MKILVFLFLIFTASRSLAIEGTRGGGDAHGLEFTAYARRIVELLEQNKEFRSLLPNGAPEVFTAAVQTTTVETKDQLFLGAREVDAINYPEQRRIEVSRDRWRATLSAASRYALVAHEFLGVARISDAKYEISSRIKSWFESHGTGSVDCVLIQSDPGKNVAFQRLEAVNGNVYRLFVGRTYAMDIVYLKSPGTIGMTTYRTVGGAVEVLTASRGPAGAGYSGEFWYSTMDLQAIKIECKLK